MATGKSTERADIPDDLTTCPICFEVFKSPKSLPCLHTFCKMCLQTFLEKASRKSNSEACCPVCRAGIDLVNVKAIEGWVEALPTNFMVNSLIERRLLESGDRKCDACQHNGTDTTATSWCKECSEALCDNCSKVHRAFKATKRHALVPICEAKDVYPESEEALDCPLHKNRKIELFCYDHELPCCLTCMTVHHRKCDKVTTLEEAAENFRENPEVSDILKRLNSMVTDYREELESHETMQSEFESMLRDVKEEIRKNKESMLKHIETLYKTLNDEVSALEKSRDIGDDKEKLQQHKMQLELSFKTLETMKSKSSNISLFLEYYKMKAKEKQHVQFIEEHKATCEKQTVEFVLNDKVKNFKTLMTSLGEIRVCRTPSHAHVPVSIDFTTCVAKEAVKIQENRTRFTDAVFLGSDVIVAVDDKQNSIWAYNSQGKKITNLNLSSDPWALAAVSDREVTVALRGDKRLEFFTFDANRGVLVSGNTISLPDTPWAVDYADDFLFVTFPNKVKKMKLDDTVVMEFSIPNSSSLCGIAHHNGSVLTANHSLLNQNITKFGSNKNIVFQRKYTKLSYPLGLTTDRSGNMYVVGWSSNNVIQLAPDGTLIREFVPASSGYKNPMGINFSKTENKFLLTHQDKISVFQFVSS